MSTEVNGAEAKADAVLEENAENEVEDDADIEAMKRRVAEIEAEYERLKGQNDGDAEDEVGTASEDKKEGEAQEAGDQENAAAANNEKSIFIGNLDDAVTPETLQDFFKACGTINRITIMCDKYTGQPKGYAYMEFEEQEAVELACALGKSP